MKISRDQIESFNRSQLPQHDEAFNFFCSRLERRGLDVELLLKKLSSFQVAVPSWALGAGGTRFGRFSIGGEPRNLKEKISDAAILHQLTKSTDAISLHIPWDIPTNAAAIRDLAWGYGLGFDAMNSNTFQDQVGQSLSYKFGSLSHVDQAVRDQAVEHNKQVIDYGVDLGSKSLTVWLADGTSFPGQSSFRGSLERTLESLRQIYDYLPDDWKLLIEYKPYEPQFYSTVIQDWGTSYMLASECGSQAYTLVDLGHHLPNTNIEQIVATLMMKAKLGGFHFNDSKYGDDDLTVGSIKPYQLFLIFHELVQGMEDPRSANPVPVWMIDASHNLKDPLEDLMQSLQAIQIAYAKALLVDQTALLKAQSTNDVTRCQEILQDAFHCDVRPLITESRRRTGAALDPIAAFRHLHIRKQLVQERGSSSRATGL